MKKIEINKEVNVKRFIHHGRIIGPMAAHFARLPMSPNMEDVTALEGSTIRFVPEMQVMVLECEKGTMMIPSASVYLLEPV